MKGDGGRAGEEGGVVIYGLPDPALILRSDWRPSVDDGGGSGEGAEALQVHGKVNTYQSL